ncbi:MAG: endopeptidase La, partial [Rickettsiaceae bacterium]|nr:endopeptidase La [Rickettsiaceae bacterium]
MNISNFVPMLPLKDVVLFPGIITPIFVGRQKSLRALSAPQFNSANGTHVLFVTQKNQEVDDPKPSDMYRVGVLAQILQTVKLQDGTIKVVVEATHRAQINAIIETSGFLSAEYNIMPDDYGFDRAAFEMLITDAKKSFSEYANSNKKISQEVLQAVMSQQNPIPTLNLMAASITCKISDRQRLLEIGNIEDRARSLIELLVGETVMLSTEAHFQNKVKQKIEKNQREYFLHEQMRVIQQELQNGEDKSELSDLEKKMKSMKLSKEAREKAESEIKKLRSMQAMSAEASIVRNHLDTLLGMPWGKKNKSKVDVEAAEKILNRDHFGLEKVKERILDYLAVLQRSKTLKGPILCFVGPPGVGKTSLVKSIAEAIGRKYCKFSLGGVRDEAEIRGHRKTYLGAMPGKVISLIKKGKTDNPVMLLDEIDKMSSDFRGDPASALLEALDPEQNKSFTDHYLEVEYDISDVMFIATSNSLNLPRPLLDRMEIIRLSGYVEDEKMQIAKRYLVPKQLKEHGIKEGEISISEDAILSMIRYYTKEAGVRNLDREIGTLSRKALRKILSGKMSKITITADDLEEYLGVKKFDFGQAETNDQVGSTTGLAYTEVGGDLLTIEAVSIPGKGEIKATGKLGDVMKESTQAAYSYFLSNAGFFGVKEDALKANDIHLHVPEGATPKDGPSAGIAIFTTIVSLMTNKSVKKTVAMTGEITLRGNVLPIGGLKEKLLAASRGGIKTVIIPQENFKDLKEVPDSIKSHLEIIPVSKAMEVLE